MRSSKLLTPPAPSTVVPTEAQPPVGRQRATGLPEGLAQGLPTLTRAETARILGQTQASTLDVYDKLPRPKDVDEAFATLPASSAGFGEVRRFADDNAMAWNMVLDLTRRATKTQDFSFFTIGKDAYGFSFLGGALYNQMRGVQVTGMTDWSSNSRGRGFVSAGRGYDYLQELAAFGGKFGVFNTPRKRIKSLLQNGLNYGLIGCNHDKAMVIDKGTPLAQGETGGRNIEAPYHQDVLDNPKSWRDDTLHIKGDAATAGFALAIERELAGRACKLVKPDLINLKSRAREMLAAYALMEEWVSRPPLSADEKSAIQNDPAFHERVSAQLVEAAGRRLETMIAGLSPEVQARITPKLTGKEERHILELASKLTLDRELAGSRARYEQLDGFMVGEVKIIDQTGAASAAPGERYNEMAPALIHLFRGAQQEILIQNPYVVLTENMIKALEEAAERGVKIRIVTNSPESTDSAVTQGFFLNDWPQVLARIPTAEIFVATGERKFHAKCFEIDGKVSGDLSYNADLLSGLVNGEIGAITRSKQSALHLRAAIEADLANPSNEFKQWTIKKDENGRAVLDAKQQPIVLRGPADDISPKLRRLYKPVQMLCKLMTHTKTGAPLRHPPVGEVLKNRTW